MRVSIHPDDPGYRTLAIIASGHKRALVILDGIEQTRVMIADEENGYVVRAVLDAAGNVQPDPSSPENFWIETVSGTVKIEVRELH